LPVIMLRIGYPVLYTSIFPLWYAVNSMADYNAAGALITARSGKVARRPSMKRSHSFDFSRRKAFLTAPGRTSFDVRL